MWHIRGFQSMLSSVRLFGSQRLRPGKIVLCRLLLRFSQSCWGRWLAAGDWRFVANRCGKIVDSIDSIFFCRILSGRCVVREWTGGFARHPCFSFHRVNAIKLVLTWVSTRFNLLAAVVSYLRRKADADKRKYVCSDFLIISCRNRFEDWMKSPPISSRCLGVHGFTLKDFLYSFLLSGGFSTHVIFIEER